MKFNKDIQIAILFTTYLSRSGRADLETIAENLSISLSFLEQIARKLRIGNVVKSIRGPGGGYELVDDSTIQHIFNAINPIALIASEDVTSYFLLGEVEHRTLVNFSKTIVQALRPVLKRKIKDIINETQANESAAFRGLTEQSGKH